EVRDAELVQAWLDLVVQGARLRHAGEVALGVGEEHRHAQAREALGEHSQRYRFAGAGGAGDHAVAVAVARMQVNFAIAFADKYLVHAASPKISRRLL